MAERRNLADPNVSLVGLGVGLAAAGVGAVFGLAAERLVVGKPLLGNRNRRPLESEDAVALGSLRGETRTVTSTDGTDLYVEVDEPEQPDPDGLTVVFCHGYCLTLDSWHYQRAALRGRVRMVLWDQRGHGRSQRGARSSHNLHQLGQDLDAVLKAVAPRGPLLLVGHSMGGMTVMSYASQHPSSVKRRVRGAALIATSAGNMAGHDLGLNLMGKLLLRVAPSTIGAVARRPGLVERTRRIGSDLEEVIVKRWSYASPVSEELVDFTARMIAATRIETVSEFLPQFTQTSNEWDLAPLRNAQMLVLTGDKDLMIPPRESEKIVELLPKAELVVVADGNHLVMLEHPDIVTPHLIALIDRTRKMIAADHE